MIKDSSNHVNPDKNEEGPWLDYLIVLAKYSRMIIYASIAGTILAYLCLFMSPHKYQATARLIPPQASSTMTAQIMEGLKLGGSIRSGGAGGLGGAASTLLGLKPQVEVYVSLLKSDAISDSIIERFNLKKLWRTTSMEDLRKDLKGVFNCNASRDGIISIEVIAKDPKLSADMANGFGEELNKLIVKLSRQQADEYLNYLEKERGQSSLNLIKAEETLRTFSEQTSIVQIDAQAKSMIEYIARLRALIDSKEVELKVMRQQATIFNYDVVRLETELKGLREKLQAAEAKADQNCIGDVCIETSKMPSVGLEYFRLYREAKYQEALYQLYCKLVELARMDAARNIATFQFIDRASPPERRYNARLRPAMLAGILTFFLMIFVAFGREHLKNNPPSENDSARLKELYNWTLQWQVDVRRLIPWRKKKT